MAALLAASLIHDAYVWMNPVKPVFFISDGKGFTRPLTPVDSPIVDDTQLLEWAVQAIIAPYNVDYHNYAAELNTASRHFTLRGWNTYANSFIGQGNFDEIKRARMLCHAQAQRAAVIQKVLSEGYSDITVANVARRTREEKPELAPGQIREQQLARLTPSEHSELVHLKEQALERQKVYQVNPSEAYKLEPRVHTSGVDNRGPEQHEKHGSFRLQDHVEHEPGMERQAWEYAERFGRQKKGERQRVS